MDILSPIGSHNSQKQFSPQNLKQDQTSIWLFIHQLFRKLTSCTYSLDLYRLYSDYTKQIWSTLETRWFSTTVPFPLDVSWFFTLILPSYHRGRRRRKVQHLINICEQHAAPLCVMKLVGLGYDRPSAFKQTMMLKIGWTLMVKQF